MSYPQLSQLQQLYRNRGFTVLAFPSGDFHQELDTNDEIQEFVHEKFPDVTFPVFGKSSLQENAVYRQLKRQMPGTEVKHNFFKYLVNRDGVAVKFFTKPQDPLSLRPDIEALLDMPSTVHHQQVLE